MNRLFVALAAMVMAGILTGAPHSAGAFSLTGGVSTPFSSPDGVLEVHCSADYSGISAGFTANGVITSGLSIPVTRLQYQVLNPVTSSAGIVTFTIYYDTALAPHIRSATTPTGYTDSAGIVTSLGGVPYTTILNAGYTSYSYNTGAPWKIVYSRDHITFSSVTPTPALPVGCKAGGGGSPLFSIDLDYGTYIGLTRGDAQPYGSSTLLKGDVVGPTLTPPAITTPAGAKALPDGTWVTLGNQAVTAEFPAAFWFYVEDTNRSQGIRVEANPVPTLYPRYLAISGLVNTVGGEKEILAPYVTDAGKGGEIPPLLMTNKTMGGAAFGLQTAVPPDASGLNNVGLLVRTTGVVKGFASDACYIDDGSGLTDGLLPGLTVKSLNPIGSVPPVGSYVAVTGVSGTEIQPVSGKLIRVLRLRSIDDVQIISRPVAYIYITDYTAAQAFKGLLDANQFPTTLIKLPAAETTDFSAYSAIIVGYDTGSPGAWGTWAAATHINASGLPITGIGTGGYAFFGRLGLQIGSPFGWHYPMNSVTAVDPSSSIYTTPNAITMSTTDPLTLYTTTGWDSAIYLTDPIPSNIETIGAEFGTTQHYPLVRQDNRYFLWGFDGTPEQMTGTAKALFINALIHNYQ